MFFLPNLSPNPIWTWAFQDVRCDQVQAQLVRLGALLLQQLAPQRGTEEAGVRWINGGWLEEMCHRVSLNSYYFHTKGGYPPWGLTASIHLKMDGWWLEYDRFLLGPGQFSGAFAVSFRECKPLITPPIVRDGHEPNRFTMGFRIRKTSPQTNKHKLKLRQVINPIISWGLYTHHEPPKPWKVKVLATKKPGYLP